MTFLSLIMIGLIHHLLLFFKDTLTVPKIKDLVVSPRHQYENMYKIISSSSNSSSLSSSPSQTTFDSSSLPSQGQESIENMKSELRKILKKNKTANPHSFSDFPNNSSIDSFSSPPSSFFSPSTSETYSPFL
jgi:hypothetical protein